MKFSNLYCQTVDRYSHRLKRPSKRLIMMIPGAGCSWYKKNGGCTMCGFNASVLKYSQGVVLPAFIFKMMYFLAVSKTAVFNQLAVFNGGSFLNPAELPFSFSKWLFKKIGKESFFSEIFVESRCEYINRKTTEEAVELLRGKKFVVAIGLESKDDKVRNQLIKKGLKREDFKEAVGTLKDAGAVPVAYVFLKPIGLTEKEALYDTLATIEYALDVGVEEIELSCAFIQEGTRMHGLYKENNFVPPRLWTIIKIIEEATRKQWPLSVGRFTDEPPPIAIPENCGKCSEKNSLAIEVFRQKGILGELQGCDCKIAWEKLIK